MNERINIKSLSLQELETQILELGESKFRAAQIYYGIYRDGFIDFSQFTTLSKSLRINLEKKFRISELKLSQKLVSHDGTQKMTFSLEDNRVIEAVWIPSTDGKRKTICISSQVGCTLSCSFCATGKLDFKGNLKHWEIVDQIYQVEKIVKDKCTNIVFMGMGEPMHNYDNVLKAAGIFHDPKIWNLGARRITISTAGVIKGIERFIQNNEPYNFAISLNHPDPIKRKDIMDIGEKYPLDDLLDVARKFTVKLKRRITFEYIMIPGINMGKKNAERLVKILRSVNCKLNLIPLNTNLNGWNRPTEWEIQEFYELLKPSGVPILNRRSPGRDINGACGMLATSVLNGEVLV